MSNAPTHGSQGAPHFTYSNPNIGRRSSYASVAAGTAQQTASVLLPPAPNQLYSDQPSRIPQPIPTDPDSPREGMTGIPEGWGSGSRETMSAIEDSEFLKPTYSPWGRWSYNVDGGRFFRPTYLRGSKYMEELEAAHNARVEAQKEEPPPPQPSHGTLSKSSSRTSLPKMQASHRGMAYEIIEREPAPIHEGPNPLPSKWAEVDKHKSIEIAGDGQQVVYVANTKLADHEAASARADHPMPTAAGIYYYEVHIEHKGKDGMIGVGFSSNKASLEKLPGWEPDSWAYHGDDGKTFCCQLTGKAFGPTFTTGDTIGCGVDFVDGTAFFTKNGNFIGHAFKDIKETALYPSVGMKRPHAHLIVNFGQRPFVFDIDKLIERRRNQIFDEIKEADISILHPTLGKDDLCKALVAQYLSHDGYVETAQAFAEEVRSETAALKGSPESPVDSYLAVEEDHDAANRQQIRAAVLDGDIDTTLALTQKHFPSVLDNPEHRDVNFRVRCRKYIEMMRQLSELLDTTTTTTTRPQKPPTKNGGHSQPQQPPEEAMDIDDDATSTSNSTSSDEAADGQESWDGDDEMDTSTSPNTYTTPSGYEELIGRAIQYGQELNATFKDPDFQEVTQELFGMLAYKDVRTSPAARWLRREERTKVAEALNGAILESLGKSSSTALERTYRQTVVITDLISENGGPGALINVRRILKKGGWAGEG